MTIADEAEYEDRLAKRTRERDNLARQLYEVKHKHADYIGAVTSAVEQTIGGIEIAPVPPYEGGGTPNYELEAVALLSDLQTGKLTPDYNSDVAHERVMKYADEIIERSRARNVRTITVPMLGDMVEGVDIFPGQQWLIDSTLYRQVFDTTPVILVDFVRRLLTWFEHVNIEAVQGNHGRLGRKGMFGPEDNADKMVYRVMGLMLMNEPRVTIDMADPVGERAWYKIMELGNYRAMLIHGDQIRGSMGFPWYGLGKKVHSWASGGLPDGDTFQDVFMGHYHQMACVPLNKRTVWANGSTESTNTFAAETLAAQSSPAQWLLFVDPVAGAVDSAYPVRLT
ncbi:hypothetical protein [Streptomyces sp. NPDC002666]